MQIVPQSAPLLRLPDRALIVKTCEPSGCSIANQSGRKGVTARFNLRVGPFAYVTVEITVERFAAVGAELSSIEGNCKRSAGTLLANRNDMLQFTQYSMLVNLLVFAIGAIVVWFCGTKLSSYVDIIAVRTGLGEAFAGVIMLGGATSLPEIATTLTAAYSGAAKLAGANLLGGVVMQIAVLALIDFAVIRGKPLTLFSPRASLLMVGVMLIVLIALASAAISSGEIFSVAGIGFWPVLLFVAYVLSLWVIYRYEGDPLIGRVDSSSAGFRYGRPRI